MGLQAHHVYLTYRIFDVDALGHVASTCLSSTTWSMMHRRLDLLVHLIQLAWDGQCPLAAVLGDGGLGHKPTTATIDVERLTLTRATGLRGHALLLASMHEAVQTSADSATRCSYLCTIS